MLDNDWSALLTLSLELGEASCLVLWGWCENSVEAVIQALNMIQ